MCIHEATVPEVTIFSAVGLDLACRKVGVAKIALCAPPSHLPDLFSNPAAAYGCVYAFRMFSRAIKFLDFVSGIRFHF